MKIENNYFVVMKIGNIEFNNETQFAKNSYCDEFTSDIAEACKFGDRRAALYAKQDFEITKNHSFESGFHIVPVKLTYEW